MNIKKSLFNSTYQEGNVIRNFESSEHTRYLKIYVEAYAQLQFTYITKYAEVNYVM